MYDQWGRAAAFAEETDDDETVLTAEEQEWTKSSWYVFVTR
jgi:hypothetical protein